MAGKKRILIIDDNRTLSRIAQGVLARQGYDSDSALDGADGVKKALEGAYDLILLDIVMPGMNGYEVCRQLKASDATKDIPIVFLTSKGNTDETRGAPSEGLKEVEQAYQCGAADFLTKPIAASELIKTVDNIFLLSRII